MFDIGWTEMLVVVCVAIVVVGPKDLPKMLRAFGRTMKTVRGLAGDFQKQFDEAVKEAELDEVKNIASGKSFAPLDDIKKSAASFEKDVKRQMEAKAEAASSEAKSPGLPEPVARKLEEMDARAAEAKAASSQSGDNGKATSAKNTKPATAKKTTAKKASPRKTTAAKTGARAKSKALASPGNKKTGKAEPAAKTGKRA